MAIKFDDNITIAEAAQAAAAIGARMVAKQTGDVLIERRASSADEQTETTCSTPLEQTYYRAVTTPDGVTHLLQGGPCRRDGDDRYWGDMVWCSSDPIGGRLVYTNGPVTCGVCFKKRNEAFAEWRRLGLLK